MPVSSKEFLDIQATIECRFTLKHLRDMIITYKQIHCLIIIIIIIIIIVIVIIISEIQFLLHIHKKGLFLLPTPTEVGFNATNSPGSYFSAIHLSQIILVF